jgi:hypothetical protein
MKTARWLLGMRSLEADEKDTSKDSEIRQVMLDCDQVSSSGNLADLQKRTGIPIEMDAEAGSAVDTDKTLLRTKIRDLSLCKTLYLPLNPRGIEALSIDTKRILITDRP